jgi:prepilin-type N-terminal cleavage/methylation domain-containing protein
MKKFIKKEKGMTLIEVILAVTILAIAAVPLFASFNTTFVIINKKQKVMDENVIIRLVKENSVDCIKDSKLIQSYNDINSDTTIDTNDSILWQNDSSTWNYPDISDVNTVKNLIVKDSSDKVYPEYEFSVSYDSSYGDSNFPNVKKFIISIYYRDDSSLVKSFNIFVNTTL